MKAAVVASFMENEEALPCSAIKAQVAESMQDTAAKLSPEPKVCMMRSEASAKIVDEMTHNNSMQWPMNFEVKQQHNKDDEW